MNPTEQFNQMLTQTIEANQVLELVKDTADQLINTQAIDYHESSALANHLYKVELAVNKLIQYLQSKTGAAS